MALTFSEYEMLWISSILTIHASIRHRKESYRTDVVNQTSMNMIGQTRNKELKVNLWWKDFTFSDVVYKLASSTDMKNKFRQKKKKQSIWRGSLISPGTP